MHVKVSIAIVSYNNFNDVCMAVQSIEQKTSKTLSKQIYIIDNANDSELYNHFLEDYPEVIYINTGKNIGFGAGHNCIIDMLDSDLHAIVNPDIVLENDAFSEITACMQDENIGMVVPKIITPDGAVQWVYRRDLTILDMFIRFFCKNRFEKRKAYHALQDMDYAKPFQVPFAQGSFLVIRTALFRELYGFDERFFLYCEDADLCKRVNQASKLIYCPSAKVVHGWQQASHKNIKLMKQHMLSAFRYFSKWGIQFM